MFAVSLPLSAYSDTFGSLLRKYAPRLGVRKPAKASGTSRRGLVRLASKTPASAKDLGSMSRAKVVGTGTAATTTPRRRGFSLGRSSTPSGSKKGKEQGVAGIEVDPEGVADVVDTCSSECSASLGLDLMPSASAGSSVEASSYSLASSGVFRLRRRGDAAAATTHHTGGRATTAAREVELGRYNTARRSPSPTAAGSRNSSSSPKASNGSSGGAGFYSIGATSYDGASGRASTLPPIDAATLL